MYFQKQPSRGVRERCSGNMQQIYRRTPMSRSAAIFRTPFWAASVFASKKCLSFCWFFLLLNCFFFSIWVFFHEYLRFTGQQGKGEGIYLIPLYHFHPLQKPLDISRAITAESSPLHTASSRTRIGNLWFPSASR